METISLKLEPNMLNEIDEKLTIHRYSTRTEFIRDAIRDKLADLEKASAMKNGAYLSGKSDL